MKVSQSFSIPFSVWFHNSYLENRKGILRILAKILQPKFFRKAKNVFAMSDGLRDEMKSLYPNVDIKTLVHGFKLHATTTKQRTNNNKIKFLYSGSLNESCKDASLRLLNVIKTDPNHEIYIYSGNPQTFKEMGIDGKNVIFKSFLPLDEFVAELWKYDIMLLPHGLTGDYSDFEYKTIFPTRTIPLLFSGKPILAHTPKSSFLSQFLKQNDCAFLVEEKNEEAIRKMISKIIQDSEEVQRVVNNAKVAAEQFRLSNVIDRIEKYV